jgi:aminopeptidase N
VYTKGGYVLHMLRMLLRDFVRSDDSRFIRMMHEYVDTWRGKNASTADFQAIVDKHFGRDMGWFFKQYVYGTEVPDIQIRYSVAGAGPDQALMIEISQKGVSPDFITLLPVVVTTEKGSFSGLLTVTGRTAQARVPLPAPLKAVEFNPLNAVLCDLKVTKL